MVQVDDTATAVPAPLLDIRSVTKRYGAVEAVKSLDLSIRAGDFLAILGPSGCGKTTLLRMIGGFLSPSSGTISIDGVDVTRRSPDRRPTNMVFQGYGLFPHMNVRQNIAYGLRIARRPAAEIRSRVDDILALGRIEALADRDIAQLSGGQQQRVALARALIMRPRVLLLDEPLAALDLKLRQAMQDELRRMHREIGGTFVFVTHDQGEAMALANRIAVMQSGTVVQEGHPKDIYSAPRTRFVATFIGEANIFNGHRKSGRVTLACGPSWDNPGDDGPVLAVVRPDKLGIGQQGEWDIEMPATLVDEIYFGTHTRRQARLSDGSLVFSNDTGVTTSADVGDGVRIGWSRHDVRVLEDV